MHLARVVELFDQLLLPASGCLFARLNGVAPVSLRLEVRSAVAERRGETGDLLDGTGHGHAHRADGGVDAVGRIDRAVGDLVDLVELPVDAIHRASDLVDHREDLSFRSRDERRKATDGSAQTYE